MGAQILSEPVQIQAQVLRVTQQVINLQRSLVREQYVVHRPEGILGSGRFGGLCSDSGMGCISGSGR
jgi:hypothetical protein